MAEPKQPKPVADNIGLWQGGLDLEASAAAGKVTSVGDAVAAGVGKVADVVPAAKADPAKVAEVLSGSNGNAIGAAFALETRAKATGGGKLDPETALAILRRVGLVEAEPPEPDFDWTSDGSVILPEQCSIAVYTNADGSAVIRREKHYPFEDDDVCIVINHKNLPEVIAALTKIAKAPRDADRRE